MKKNLAKIAIAKNIPWLLTLILFYTAFELASTALAARLGEIFDIVTVQDKSTQNLQFFENLLAFLINFVAIILFYILYSQFQARYIQRICTFTRKKYFEVTLKKSIADINKNDKAYYQSVLINDMKQLENNYFFPMLDIIKKILSAIVALAFLMHYSIPILIFVVIASFLPIIFPKLLSKKLEASTKSYEETMEKYTLACNELLFGYEFFQNYNAESRALSVHREVNENYAKTQLRASYFVEFVQDTAIFSGYFVGIGVLILGMIFSVYGYLSVGDIFAVYFISGGITSTFNEMIQYFPEYMAGKVFARKFECYVNDENPKSSMTILNEIAINELSISYDNQTEPALKNINMNFKIGKKYLLLGPSGGGKTTILKAIMGYYNPEVGEITYDGIRLNPEIQNSIFDKIAYVPQQSNFFQGTIRENISVFNESVTDKNIEEALKTVELYEKISALGGGILGKGLDVVISENAVNFSGGEKQCLALARALVKDVNFYILDESTSAIDIKSAINIEKALLTDPSHTIIFSSHHLQDEILRLCDEIVVVDSGELKEKGNYETLLAAKGNFFNLYKTKDYMRT